MASFVAEPRDHEVVDAVVVGSGAAGLLAACRAADRGLDVLVLEASSLLGGSTAVSGGVLWVPHNHVAERTAWTDSRVAGWQYLRATCADDVSDEMISWFLDTAPRMARYLTDELGVDLVALGRPDYMQEAPGAQRGGRSLDNREFDIRAHAGLEEVLRASSYFPPMTIAERDAWQGGDLDHDLLSRRRAAGVRTMGGALVGALLAAARERGVRFVVDARVTGLDLDDGPARVDVVGAAHRWTASAATGVVLATGGFEWSEALQRAFLTIGVAPTTPPQNRGDGLLMGLRAGAAVTRMTDVWRVPAITDVTRTYDGAPLSRAVNPELALPGSIMVNRYGRRFVNEAKAYHDLCRAFVDHDPRAGGLRNQPAWIVFDQRYRDAYAFAGYGPDDSLPDWVTSAPSIQALGAAVGIDGSELERTIAQFNDDARAGSDTAFGRGANAQDRHLGDESVEPNPSLAPLRQGPFYAAPIRAGTIGTSGGLVTDDAGRVLDHTGAIVPGLHAAGNVSASPFGDSYPGAGATISAAATRGFSAGDSLAS